MIRYSARSRNGRETSHCSERALDTGAGTIREEGHVTLQFGKVDEHVVTVGIAGGPGGFNPVHLYSVAILSENPF